MAVFFLYQLSALICTSCFPTSGPLHLLFSPAGTLPLAFASFGFQLQSHLLTVAFPNCPILKVTPLLVSVEKQIHFFLSTPSLFRIYFIISALFPPLEYKLHERKDCVCLKFSWASWDLSTQPGNGRRVNAYWLNEGSGRY